MQRVTTHPGEVIQHDLLQPMGVSVEDAARRLQARHEDTVERHIREDDAGEFVFDDAVMTWDQFSGKL